MKQWHQVAAVGEIAPGKPKILTVNGKEVGVFYEGGRYYAILNYCPHFGAPVCLGKVSGAVVCDDDGKQSYDASRPILRCPWHRWEFDMETGLALTPIKERLKTYAVQLETQPDCSQCDAGVGSSGIGNSSVSVFEVRVEGNSIWVEL